jgi:hypothetical protein
VFENRVLRRKFGPKREPVTGRWRRLESEFHNLHPLPCNIRVTKSRRIKLSGHVAHTIELRMHTKFWSENQKGRDYSEDLDERIILNWMLGK